MISVFKKIEDVSVETNYTAPGNDKSTSVAAVDDSPFGELNGVWSYNESFDISKYEDFDHSRFLGMSSA